MDDTATMDCWRAPDCLRMRCVPHSTSRAEPVLWSRGTAARETLCYLDRNGIDGEPLLLKGKLVACETRVAEF